MLESFFKAERLRNETDAAEFEADCLVVVLTSSGACSTFCCVQINGVTHKTVTIRGMLTAGLAIN